MPLGVTSPAQTPIVHKLLIKECKLRIFHPSATNRYNLISRARQEKEMHETRYLVSEISKQCRMLAL